MVTTTNPTATTPATSSIQQKRDELKAISNPLKMLLREGAINSINEGLIKIYAEQGHTTLHSYRHWQKLGYQVKQGSKALLLWGQPKAIDKKTEQTATDEQKEESFFPVAFVFSNLQVEKI